MFNVKVNNLNIQFTFKHFRDVGEAVNVSDVTQCTLKINQDEFHAIAACSMKDKFDKEKGRKISLRRALDEARKKIEMSPRERQAVWERYFQRNESNMTWQWLWNEQTLADGKLDPEYQNVKAKA